MNRIAMTPPMGWNSFDCYGASVTEEEVRKNAQYMAEHMKQVGWEYVVVDVQWYEPGAVTSAYRKFVPLEMDEYSRLIPAVNRFPSAAGGKGFGPLADYIHGLGLKFGIHIMRGVPRQAAHAATPILGSTATARDIAHPYSICKWNTDMYGVDVTREGAQAYYDSLFALYASWGLDFVKVDDISYPYQRGEIEAVRRAIDRCGRDIVLSLSPGEAPLEEAEHLKANANMWRISGDFWDDWSALLVNFDRAAKWSEHAGPGHWPDADMLPLGHISVRGCENGFTDRRTRFSQNEQVTLMTLWCIFRSPLMVGGELNDNDDFTLSLLTNEEVLHMHRTSSNARRISKQGDWDRCVVWAAEDGEDGRYAAVFNTGNTGERLTAWIDRMGLSGRCSVRDLWSHSDLGESDGEIALDVPSHGARLIHLKPIKE